VILTLRQGKLTHDLRLRVESIHEAQESLANREVVRQRIKRARDSMWASVGQVPLQSNRIERAAPMDGSYFFRGNFGGSRGRR